MDYLKKNNFTSCVEYNLHVKDKVVQKNSIFYKEEKKANPKVGKINEITPVARVDLTGSSNQVRNSSEKGKLKVFRKGDNAYNSDHTSIDITKSYDQ